MLRVSYMLAVYGAGAIVLPLLLICDFWIYVNITKTSRSSHKRQVSEKPLAGYLVNSPSCRIPDLNPFDLSTAEFVRRENHTEFYSKTPLTEIMFNPGTEETYLQMKRDAMKLYTEHDTVHCCIYALHQTNTETTIRWCDYLSNKTWILDSRFQMFVVSCHDTEGSLIYENLHGTVVRMKRNKGKYKAKKSSLNVLVVGLDSISRLNLYRTMPLTVTHLHTRGWTELRGYNKIADNTLPNLMALLTGIPPDKLRSPHLSFFDGYPFIWKEFAAAGYVTAYVEDSPSLRTFDSHLKGFFSSPTDYYPSTLFKITEHYAYFRRKQCCLGMKSSSDHLFSYLVDFAQAHSEDPFFGLFWVNDFSHNNLNKPSSEDVQVLETLQKLEDQGTLNTTVLLFLSDHGLRVGDFRKTRIGWYEDRLPFLFVSFPEWYRSQNAKGFSNLLNNADKLTSPFDVYKTLSHLLHGDDLKEPIGCKTCHSLLEEIPSDRSCSDAGVSPHWCACHDLAEASASRSTTGYWAELVVRAINEQVLKLADLEVGYVCAPLSVRSVLYLREKVNTTECVIGVETAPGGAQFEATVVQKGDRTTVEEAMSRVNLYGLESHCSRNPLSKPFCYCLDVGTNE